MVEKATPPEVETEAYKSLAASTLRGIRTSTKDGLRKISGSRYPSARVIGNYGFTIEYSPETGSGILSIRFHSVTVDEEMRYVLKDGVPVKKSGYVDSDGRATFGAVYFTDETEGGPVGEEDFYEDPLIVWPVELDLVSRFIQDPTANLPLMDSLPRFSDIT